MKSLKSLSVRGGAKLALLSILFVNLAFADATSDARIQAYKSNGLIPEGLVIPTSTGANDSDEVVSFQASTLTWRGSKASSIVQQALKDKYAAWTGLTYQDFRSVYIDDLYTDENGLTYLTMYTDNAQDIADYLALVRDGQLTDVGITSSEAETLFNNKVLYAVLGEYTYGTEYGAPRPNIKLTGKEDLSEYPHDAYGSTDPMTISNWSGISETQFNYVANEVKNWGIDQELKISTEQKQYAEKLSSDSSFHGFTIIVDGDRSYTVTANGLEPIE